MEERRAFLIRRTAVVIGFVSVPFVLLYLGLGEWWLAGLVSPALVGAIAGRVALDAGHRGLAAQCLTATAFLCFAPSVWLAGGWDSGFWAWLLITPLLGGLLGGMASTWVWAGITIATLVGMFVASLAQVSPPTRVDLITHPGVVSVQILGLVGLIAAAVYAFLRTQEWALERSNEAIGRLESEVETRRQAELAARAAVEARGQFLATMSHELRTPMNGVLGMADLLGRSGLTPEQQHMADTLASSGQLLMTHLDSILDYSRMESGRLTLEPRAVRLGQVLAAVTDLMRVKAQESGLDFRTEVDPALPQRIRTDPTRLQQILLNLTSNAIKFTAEGEVFLRVTARAGQLRFEVHDTGIGIPEETIERLFHPFEQADASTTRRFGGTGLGLAIVRGLVEGMSGQVGATSVVGEGSCFWFEIPLVDLGEATASLPGLPEASISVAAESLRVLVADDNRVNQLVAQRFLQTLGHEATIVADGEAAVAGFDRGSFDLILMDVHMPGMDGLEATRLIRERTGGEVPIIALTASAMAEDKARCEAAGIDGFLAKPLSVTELAAVITKVTERTGRSRSRG